MENFSLGYHPEMSLENDYSFAIIHLLWYIHKDRGRHLVFGMVECHPAEIATAFETNEQGGKFKGGERLYYIRIKKPIHDALKWYKACKTDGFITMDWDKDKNEKNKEIHCGEMIEIPQWPNLVLSNLNSTEKAPFVAEEWGSCRIHHLFSIERKEFLNDFVNHNNSAKWINERLLWDINEFEELIGSLHLVLPNPIYRTKNLRLIPGSNGQTDKVKVKFTLRQGKNLHGLEILSIEKLHFGVAGGHAIPININANVFLLQLTGRAEEYAMLIRCPQRGLLDYSPFGSFIRSINIKMLVASAKKTVITPHTKENYSVTMYDDSIESIVGGETATSEMELGNKLCGARALRKRKKISNEYGQKLFYNNPKDAQDFVRQLIGKAQKRVLIIDPYFAADELFKFAFAIKSSRVAVQIVTSALFLKDKSQLSIYKEEGISSPEKGKELHNQISDLSVSVIVMTGDQPLIHDRFLIVDDEIWLSGNSLHTLGERMSMMMRLPNPNEVLDLINQIINNKDRVTPLEEWINRKNINNQCELLDSGSVVNEEEK